MSLVSEIAAISGVRDGHRNRKNRCDFGALSWGALPCREPIGLVSSSDDEPKAVVASYDSTTEVDSIESDRRGGQNVLPTNEQGDAALSFELSEKTGQRNLPCSQQRSSQEPVGRG